MTSSPRYLTSEIPPVPGVIKQRPEDFYVEELPAYEPCGEGEHLYLLIQKQDRTTLDVASDLARHFDVKRSAVGYAGLKDARAVTRQMFSVYLPGKDENSYGELHLQGAEVLWTDRHTNKLRRGHLKGNRFVIRLRDVQLAHVIQTEEVMRILEKKGVPNRFGPQRFGMRGNNDLLGRLLLLNDARGFINALLGPDEIHPDDCPESRAAFAAGDYRKALNLLPRSRKTESRVLKMLASGRRPKQAVKAMDDATGRLYISAFQSRLFNKVLDERIAAGTFTTLEQGDIAFRHDNGASFRILNIAEQQSEREELAARMGRMEISPTGPMFGPAMMPAEGKIKELEDDIINQSGVTTEHFNSCDLVKGTRQLGERRPLRAPVRDYMVEAGYDEFGNYIKCAFELPRGSYATAVLSEIIKSA